MGRSLLAAMAKQLHAVGNNPVAARRDLAEYDEMAFSFQIECTRIGDSRDFARSRRERYFVGPVGPLLGEPPGPQSLLAVAWLLANSNLVVPANAAAQSLLGVLPVPAPEPRKSEAAPQAQRENDLRPR